jgi:galactokinase
VSVPAGDDGAPMTPDAPDAGIHRPEVDEEAFARLFGVRPEAIARACGRVNLIGEHTDYNGGFVLPTLIPQAAAVALSRRAARRVRAWSREESASDGVIEYRLGEEAVGCGWVDYVQGVTHALAREGHQVAGFDLWLASDVPLGSGLSSSAALEVALLRALRRLFGLMLDDVTLARLGRAAETDFVGVPIGIMDQMASSLARPGEALFVDTRSLATEHVALPAGAELVVINSGVAHSHVYGDYRTRRAECEHAAALLGVTALRDVGVADLARVAELPEPLDRRARHVVTENQRVLDSVAAMRAGDVAALGRLFTESHVSQRDDYQCSAPEVDLLVDLALADRAVIGARLTGGGFGGSIVALARPGEGAAAAARIADAFAATGQRPTVL